jgi:hypothetical protein
MTYNSVKKDFGELESIKTDDLFDNDKDIAYKLISVKRKQYQEDEKWFIFEDNLRIFTLSGSKLTKKEKTFLRTPEGFRFLIDQYKTGNKSLYKIKHCLKNKIK